MVKSKTKGPVVQRRDQIDEGTTDQRLLDSEVRRTGSTPIHGA